MHVFSYAMEMRSLRAAVTSLMEAENRRRQRMKRISQQSSVVPSADCMLSKKEVAAQLHVSERMVERYVKDGLLPTYRLGSNGSCRFKNKDIERLLIAQETTATEDHVSDFITHQLKG